MPEIRSVLATVEYCDNDLRQLREAFAGSEFIHCAPTDDHGIRQALERVDVAVLAADLDERFLNAPRLRWAHCDHAGINKSARPEVFERGLIVTGSAGRSGPALAQHAFFFALALLYDVRTLLAAQADKDWHRGRPNGDKLALWGKTLGIIGFGHTGRAMAVLGRAFGMRVIVYRRRGGEESTDVDVMLSTDRGDQLVQLTAVADVIMVAASLSNETHHLIDRQQLRDMNPEAVVINMARGGLIDEGALVDALRNHEIAGAGLDVYETEPLPAASALWELDNVLLTPHATPRMPDKTQRSIDTIVENARRFRSGEPLLNAITSRDVYTRDQ